MNLSTESQAHAGLVGVASGQCASRLLVAPGEPAKSYLINKVTGVGLCSGSKMPKTGSGLGATQVDTLRAWIAAGALED